MSVHHMPSPEPPWDGMAALCDQGAEQALLGGLLTNNAALDRVVETVHEADFSSAVHGRIYAAIKGEVAAGRAANPVTLRHRFDQDGGLSEAGGGAYLASLLRASITTINAPDLARIISGLARRRRLVALADDIRARAAAIEEPAEETAAEAQAALDEIMLAGAARPEARPLAECVWEAIRDAEEAHKGGRAVTGLTTGLAALDEALGGLGRQRLYILGGRPSMGKSAVAYSIALAAARAGAAVGFWSLEMSESEIGVRHAALETDIAAVAIQAGRIGGEDWQRLTDMAHAAAGLRILVDAPPRLSIAELRARARRMKRSGGLDLLVVDYLQLMHDDAQRGRRDPNRVQEISDITRGLKAIAKELDIPVLALSQLSRQVEAREDKRPQLADLRDSGSIEQDADVVMFVYREEYYLQREGEPQPRPGEAPDKHAARLTEWHRRRDAAAGIAEIIVAKQRQGPTLTVKSRFERRTMRFENMEGQS